MNYMLKVYPSTEDGSQPKKLIFETAEQMIVSRDSIAAILIYLQDDAKSVIKSSLFFVTMEKVNGEWVGYEEF